MKKHILCFAAMLFMVSNINAQTTIYLNANDKGMVFEDIGAVSAGASTRNLVDYPEKQRAEVLY